ncbi:hypothetical protein QPL39_23485 [Escherichia coli]|uniref:hypothetical protein n=1 Tax=Escherichia coli TaxID=562 RepID=UPI00287970E0|nr:hypothetical protein [Escherichia coli]MDS1727860.1 hypothetical protein [Escherichia coli]
MDEQIKALLNQIRILETEANNHTGNERAELFKAAGRIKNQVATLLNQQGKGQQQQPESKIPDPTTYFGANLPDGFGDYFSGDYLTPEMESYFAVPKIQNFDNAPSAKQEPAKAKVFDDWEYRRKVLNALGIPC